MYKLHFPDGCNLGQNASNFTTDGGYWRCDALRIERFMLTSDVCAKDTPFKVK